MRRALVREDALRGSDPITDGSEQLDQVDNDDDDDDAMEQQFQNAYDEVVALKRLLQDLLNVERSEALAPDARDGTAADCLLDSDDYDVSDEYEADECDDDEQALEEQLQADPAEWATSDSESESSRRAVSPVHVMSFSDELRSFTPAALAPHSATPKRRVVLTRPRLRTAAPRVARRSTLEPRAMTASTISRSRNDDRSKSNNNHDGKDRNGDSEAHAPPPTHTQTPRASRSSLKLLRASATFEPNFQARMRQFVAQNRQKKEQIRLAVCEQEDVCLQPTPMINRRSKRIYRSVSHLMAWNHEKESKLAHLRQAEAARAAAEAVGKPAIARHSTALFAQRSDELAHCRVEDRLQLLGLIYKYQQEERLLAERSALGAFHPRVAPHSANLARRAAAVPLAAHERLYQLALRRAKRTDASSATDNQAEPQSAAQRERTAVPSAATVQRLLAFGAEYETKLQAQRELQRLRAARLHDTPKLSKTSRKLALRRHERTATAVEPLQHARCMCCRRQPSEPAHTPADRVDAARARAIFTKQVQWKHAKDAKDAELKRFYDDLARSECTFRNPYTDAWRTGTTTAAAAHASGDANTAFFERTMAWAMKREKRLAREKQVWDEIYLTECTFQPQLSPRKRPAARAQSAWSPDKSMAVSDNGLSSPLAQRPLSPYGCSSTASWRFASSPLSSPQRQQSLVTLSTFALPLDTQDTALDLEALAATTTRSSQASTSSRRSASRR